MWIVLVGSYEKRENVVAVAVRTLEKNIVNGMECKHCYLDQMIEVQDYESYQISFSSNGWYLHRTSNGSKCCQVAFSSNGGICIGRAMARDAVMLPPHDVVKDLPRLEMQTVDPISLL